MIVVGFFFLSSTIFSASWGSAEETLLCVDMMTVLVTRNRGKLNKILNTACVFL